jgi:hypothetical protein
LVARNEARYTLRVVVVVMLALELSVVADGAAAGADPAAASFALFQSWGSKSPARMSKSAQ